MVVGGYELDANIDKSISKEFSWWDYLKTKPVSFKNEQFWRGSSITFLDTDWQSVIATVNERIYKIALLKEFPAGTAHLQPSRYLEIRLYFAELYGEPKALPSPALGGIWGADFGNVVVELKGLCIFVFYTSNNSSVLKP